MRQALFAQTPQLDYLQAHLLPAVLEQARGQRQALCIWSVGCQAGDEAAALALALQSVLGEQMAARQVRIFAADLDPLTLARARQRLSPALPPADAGGRSGARLGNPAHRGLACRKRCAIQSSSLLMICCLSLPFRAWT